MTAKPDAPAAKRKTDATPSRGNIIEIIGQLREQIVSGRLMPHERLIEADLALALSTNRSNIRTAFAVLEGEGLVVRELNRGARVRHVSQQEAIEIAETREMLEGLAARRAAKRATAKDRRYLSSILDEMQREYDAGNLLALSQLNGKLHNGILAIADQATLSRVLMNMKDQLVRVQYRTILMPDRAAHSLAEHRRIVDAIAAGLEDDAEAAMRAHLRSVLDNLIRSFEFAPTN